MLSSSCWCCVLLWMVWLQVSGGRSVRALHGIVYVDNQLSDKVGCHCKEQKRRGSAAMAAMGGGSVCWGEVGWGNDGN